MQIMVLIIAHVASSPLLGKQSARYRYGRESFAGAKGEGVLLDSMMNWSRLVQATRV